MTRLLAMIVCALVFGCGDPSATAPMLTITVVGSDGTSHSIGRHHLFSTGILSESGDGNSDGPSKQQRIILQKIAEDGVTLSFELFDSSGEDFTKQFHVGYDKETKVELPNQLTLVATLKARE